VFLFVCVFVCIGTEGDRALTQNRHNDIHHVQSCNHLKLACGVAILGDDAHQKRTCSNDSLQPKMYIAVCLKHCGPHLRLGLCVSIQSLNGVKDAVPLTEE